ncbi:hypothetical protein M5K25_001532 [Dendrobium thyrsiflorum]|uniref:Reverse transcriptase zinc-binding domain-containing protein n=1 Tax=Dendrobium thyrsiflorum TaxID=117978 RepID=A0ABD0VRP3_DENTH
MISGLIQFGSDSVFFLSIVYASNLQSDRVCLWDNLKEIRPDSNMPWIILGDFNCCRFPFEKSGGSSLSASQTWDFNSFIFDAGLMDLASKGLNFTWFNQRPSDPIHLKLDRMLINETWLEKYPHSFYEVANPICSDHSPIILHPSHQLQIKHRFLFKNLWTKQDDFWADLLHVFALPFRGNPILGLYSKLHMLKLLIKKKTWANSSHLSASLADLKLQQANCLSQLSSDPLNRPLNHTLHGINTQISECTSSWVSWIQQRAKLSWLAAGEDNLKFLYTKIRIRRNQGCSPLVASEDSFARQDQISAIIQHFQSLFNSSPPTSTDIAYWIRGAIIPKACLNLIGKMCAKFLYFGDSKAKKLHLVSWNNTCKPADLGGLGIPNLSALQSASFCSLIFRYYNSNSLLADFFDANYGTPWTPVSNNASVLWKNLTKVAETIAPNLLFAYNANSKISMLWDPWLNGSNFYSNLNGLTGDIPHNAKVSDYVCDGSWLLPASLTQNLASFSILNAASECLTWKLQKARFAVYISEFYKGEEPVFWSKYIWHKHFALKYSIYAWLALKGGLKTADVLYKRNIIIEQTCPLCFAQQETTDHILFECDYSYSVLINVIPIMGNFLLRPRLSQLLVFLGDCNFSVKGQYHLYLLTVCCATYNIWRERNERRFNSNYRSSSSLSMLIKSSVERKAAPWKVWAGNNVICKSKPSNPNTTDKEPTKNELQNTSDQPKLQNKAAQRLRPEIPPTNDPEVYATSNPISNVSKREKPTSKIDLDSVIVRYASSVCIQIAILLRLPEDHPRGVRQVYIIVQGQKKPV